MIDQTALSAFFKNDQGLLKRFLELIVEETPGLINLVDEALHNEHHTELFIWLHSLRSRIQYLGFPDLVDRLIAMEQMAKNQEPIEHIQSEWTEMQVEFQQIYEVVEALQRTLKF
jgi:HPt (histidine-containing phosphotransfer) domain-containing protein